MAKLALPNATVMSAEVVATGSFRPSTSIMPWMAQAESLYRSLDGVLPRSRRIPSEFDSDIKIEVWLPLEGWNGKLQGRGNGGFAGEIDDFSLALRSTKDMPSPQPTPGHAASGTDARWAIGHPEKVTDFGYRAIHEMTQDAKLVVKQFYGKHPLQHAYFASCSNGGRQALMEAQRFPADYDGIIAGAPANYWTHLLTSAIWQMQATMLIRRVTFRRRSCRRLQRRSMRRATRKMEMSDGILNDPTKMPLRSCVDVVQGRRTPRRA